MQGRYRLGLGAIGLTVGVLMAAGQVLAASGPQSSTLANDKLNTAIWTQVIGQNSGLSMIKPPGWLTISTEPAPVRSYATTLHNMVLQPVSPSANWTVSVETTLFGIKFGPSGTLPNYQGGAVYAWQNAQDWVRMLREPSDCMLTIGSLINGTFTPGTTSSQAAATVCNNSADPLWLRLQKNGNVYTGYYSTDGKTWVSAGSATLSSLQPADIGLNANEGGGSAAPTYFGFKDFTVGTAATSGSGSTSAASSTTSSTTSSAASSTTSSTPSSSASSTSSSTTTTTSGSLPKTGTSPLEFVAGLVLMGIGAWQLRRTRRGAPRP